MDNNSNKNNSSIYTISIVIIIVIFAKISGLVRDIFILRNIGAGIYGDAFAFASQIPRDFLDMAFGTAISASFIPIYSQYLEKNKKDEAYSLASSFINIFAIISLFLSILGFIFASPLASSFFSDNLYVAYYAASLLRITIFTIFLTVVAFSFVGILQSHGSFKLPSIMSLLFNLIIILYLLVFFDYFGLVGLAFSFILGSIAQIFILLPSILKKGFKYNFNFNFKSIAMKKIWRLTPYAMISAWLFPINSIISSRFAANYSDGTLVHLRAAQTFFIVLSGVFILSISNVLFPKLSRDIISNRLEFENTISVGISSMLFFLIPMAIGISILSMPIIILFYEGQEFTRIDSIHSANALSLFSIGIIGFGIQNLLSRAYFAMQNIKIPLISSIVGIAINIILNFFFTSYYGAAGAAFSMAISINIAGFIMFFYIGIQIKELFRFGYIFNILKMAFSGFIMAIFIIISREVINFDSFIFEIIISILIGIIIYFLFVCFFKINEISFIKNKIFKR